MVDEAPPPEAVLPELGRLLRGRVLVAHSARFDLGVLRGAFARAALDWPEPPVLCTVAMARRLAPLQRRRGLAALADALGIEVEVTHRALPDAETCARVFCALFGRLTAHAATIGEAVALLGPGRRSGGGRRPRAGARRRPPAERPDFSALPRDPGVYVFRDADGHPLYVGKSVCLRTRARAHFTTPAEWTGQAEHVDYQATRSELGALLLEDRLIKTLRPPGQHARQAHGRRLRLPALPARHPVPDPRGRARAGRRARRDRRARARARRRGRAGRAAQLAVRPAPLRPRAAAPRAPERVRADGALPLALPRRPRPEPLPRAARPGAAAVRRLARRRRRAARPHRRRSSAPPPAERNYERAAWLRRRRERLEGLRAAARRPAARDPHRRAARARAASRAARPLRRVLDRRRARGRLGRAARTTRTSWPRAPPPRCAPCRGRSWAAGCRPTRSPRRGSSARGSRRTTRRGWSSTRACSRAERLARWIRAVECRV